MTEAANRYASGQQVRVRMSSDGPNPRTPHYVRGKVGTIVALRGVTHAAHDHRATYPFLYTVAFDVSEISGAGSGDRVLLDLHEEWLDPA
jgi:hypothetical protein